MKCRNGGCRTADEDECRGDVAEECSSEESVALVNQESGTVSGCDHFDGASVTLARVRLFWQDFIISVSISTMKYATSRNSSSDG